MPRQTISSVSKTTSAPKRRTSSTSRRVTKKSEPLISDEQIIRQSSPVSSGASGSGVQALFLVVLIVVLGVTGYYWFAQKQQSSSDTSYQDYQIPLGVSVPTTPEPAPEVVLQTYQDDVAQYSFAYPQDWSITASSTSGNKRTVVFGSDASTTISVITARTPKPLTQYVSELDILAQTAAAGKPSVKVEESRDVAVNSVPVIARRQTLLATGQQELIAYFGIKDYIVSIAVTDTEIATSSVQLYESLVNSFALLASSTPSIATTTATTTATSTQSTQ